MIKDDEGIFYERQLPHYQPLDATYTVIFRLVGSLPAKVIVELRAERDEFLRRLSGTDVAKRTKLRAYNLEHMKKFDSLLDRPSAGHQWLKNPGIAKLVADSIHYWDKRAYELLAFCIMPNHVHLVISSGTASTIPLPEFPMKGQTSYHLTNILSSIKKYSAHNANRLLHRSGPFWQSESYDHIIRDEEELERTILYVLDNPAKAGLTNDWKEWPWNYVKEGSVDED